MSGLCVFSRVQKRAALRTRYEQQQATWKGNKRCVYQRLAKRQSWLEGGV